MKFGVVGTNFVSDWFCEAVRLSGVASVAAVYSRADKTGSEFAEKHNIPFYYSDFSAFLSSGIDAVYIASPNKYHFEQAMAAIDAGLSVLVEKPICPSLDELTQLCKRRESAGVLVMEAMRPLFDPIMELIKKTLPRLGRPRSASFEFCQYSSRYDRFKAGEVLNAFNPSLSNAALLDIGIYPLTYCTALFGSPTEVTSHSVFLENGMEGAGTVLLGYPDMTVTVNYSKISSSVTPSVILGECGAITFENPTKPCGITFISRGGEREFIENVACENNMIYEVKRFCELFSSGDFSCEYMDITKKTLALIDEVKKSSGIVFA